jgi:hypothetical protein
MLPDEQPARQKVKPEQAQEEGPQPWPTEACWPVHVCHCLTTSERGLRRVQNAGLRALVRVFKHLQTAICSRFVPLHAADGTQTRLRAALIPLEYFVYQLLYNIRYGRWGGRGVWL